LPVSLLQITDCHLGNQPGDDLLGVDADYSLDLVLAEMRDALKSADLLACTGDLSNEAGPAAFKRLLQKLSTTANGVKQAWLPGNHDDNTEMAEVLDGAPGEHSFLDSLSLGAWQITFLDSTIPKKVPGILAESEILRAEKILQQFPDKHHLFFLHHHLLPVGCKWLDWQAVQNSDDVLQRFSQYPQLKAIVNGHVHQEHEASFGHIQLMSTPSTSVQFKKNSDDFAIDDLMPGFRWFLLHDSGKLETAVERIGETHFNIDHEASGY
jgi:Icc protein